jgi:hypothetical protein
LLLAALGCRPAAVPGPAAPLPPAEGPAPGAVEARAAPAPATEAGPGGGGPEASLAPVLARLEKGTRPRTTNFVAKDKWAKRRGVATDVRHEIRKTDSPDSPFEARVTWRALFYLTGDYATRGEAEDAPLPARPYGPVPAQYWARYRFRDGAWALEEVGWRQPALRLEVTHSTLRDPQDPLDDWWQALGGK